MKQFFLALLPFLRYRIQTRLSRAEILQRIEEIGVEEEDYRIHFSESGFCVAEKHMKSRSFLISNNSFAPVAKGTISEADGVSTVSVCIRMNWFAFAFMLPLYFLSALLFIVGAIGTVVAISQAFSGVGGYENLPSFLILFSLLQLLLQLAFRRPAKRLWRLLETRLLS